MISFYCYPVVLRFFQTFLKFCRIRFLAETWGRTCRRPRRPPSDKLETFCRLFWKSEIIDFEMRWIEFISFIYAFKNWEIQENSWLFMRLDLSEHSTDQSRIFSYFKLQKFETFEISSATLSNQMKYFE